MQRSRMARVGAVATVLVTVIGGVAGRQSAFATTTVVTLSSDASGVDSPIGIDYYQPSNEIVISDHYNGGGVPNNFDLVDSSGNVSPLGTASGIGAEVYMSTIRTSTCEGGFTPGDMYFGDNNGNIDKLSVGGTLTAPWVTLPGEAGTSQGGIFQDVYCVAGGDLIFTNGNGDVWKVDSNGSATALASGFGGGANEGPTTVPNDPRYGPWAGQILVSDEGNGVIWSIDPTTGAAARWDGGGNWAWAEGVHIVPPNQNFFASDYANGAVLAAPASQFAGIVGDVVLATELPGRLLDIEWNSATSTFDSYDLLSTDAGQFEGTAFAPAGLPGLPSTAGADQTSLSASAANGDYADTTSVSGTLMDTTTNSALSGESVTFKLNSTETCTATTNVSGIASCPLKPGETSGTYPLTDSFAGDSGHSGSNGSANFIVNQEETGLSYTGATSGVNGQPMTLSGTLTTDDPAAATGLGGKTVAFTLGSGVTAQTCSGSTASTGAVSCSIASVNQTPGTVAVSGSFTADNYYKGASVGSSVTVFSPPALGAFVIGNTSAGAPTTGRTIEFWGSQWSTVNVLSGGSAPPSMKGYANSPQAFTCGSKWTTTTGSSSVPPTTLPGMIEVIVSSQVKKSGSQLSGNIVHIVWVQVARGYSNAAGHTGTGTIVSTVC